MRRKYNKCLCGTCFNTCCDRKNCTGKKESCENYNGFRQMSIFDVPSQSQSAPRKSWRYYGIDKKRYNHLVEYIRSGRYTPLALSAAHTACEIASRHILLSIEKNLSYDDLERMWTLKEIERIPVGRSDFYGWRRYFFSILDKELRRIGK